MGARLRHLPEAHGGGAMPQKKEGARLMVAPSLPIATGLCR